MLVFNRTFAFAFLLLGATSPLFAQTIPTGSSELLYSKNVKPVAVAENNQQALRTPPVRGFQPITFARQATRNTRTPLMIVTDNPGLLTMKYIPGLKLNPSATADYCTPPAAMQGCCWYNIPNQSGNEESYTSPKSLFASEDDARNFYLSLKPEMPFYLPDSEGTVGPVNGWYYGGGDGHGSVDYLKTGSAYGPGKDPTFDVLATADGKVINTDWNDLFGNYVILEHKTPKGTLYRTGYFHLRDGFDHDLQLAKKVNVTSNNKFQRDSLYVRFANMANPSTQLWGTNQQAIKVKNGDMVRAGQHIAFAGNTGYGGAGWGLDTMTAKPTNPNTGNNHLHFMLWVKAPANTNGVQWLEVDAYGMYAVLNGNNESCLQPGNDKAFDRFFAPHFPSFHGLPAEAALADTRYFPEMGIHPQTFNISRQNSEFIASGAYEYTASANWAARVNMSADSYQKYFNEYSAQGMTPRQISACKDNNGNALFTVIWRKLEAGEVTSAIHHADDATFTAAWKKQTEELKRSCVEHIRYESGGKSMHAAVFSTINKGYYAYTGMSAPDLQKTFDDLSKKGFMPINISAEEVGGKTTYGGVWAPANGKQFVALADLSPSAYQQKFTELVSQGYRLYRIMAYGNSTKYAAIWAK